MHFSHYQIVNQAKCIKLYKFTQPNSILFYQRKNSNLPNIFKLIWQFLKIQKLNQHTFFWISNSLCHLNSLVYISYQRNHSATTCAKPLIAEKKKITEQTHNQTIKSSDKKRWIKAIFYQTTKDLGRCPNLLGGVEGE